MNAAVGFGGLSLVVLFALSMFFLSGRWRALGMLLMLSLVLFGLMAYRIGVHAGGDHPAAVPPPVRVVPDVAPGPR